MRKLVSPFPDFADNYFQGALYSLLTVSCLLSSNLQNHPVSLGLQATVLVHLCFSMYRSPFVIFAD
jgi:hypothetical protein